MAGDGLWETDLREPLRERSECRDLAGDGVREPDFLEPLRDRFDCFEPLRERCGVRLRLRDPVLADPLRERLGERDFSEPASICRFGEWDRLSSSAAAGAVGVAIGVLSVACSSPELGLRDRDVRELRPAADDAEPERCECGEFDLKKCSSH